MIEKIRGGVYWLHVIFQKVFLGWGIYPTNTCAKCGYPVPFSHGVYNAPKREDWHIRCWRKWGKKPKINLS